MHTALRILGWSIAGVVYAGAGLMMLAVGLALLWPILGWAFIPAVAVVALGFYFQLRRRRGTFILTHLDQATRMDLPLAQTLAAQSASEFGPLGWRLGRIAGLLEHGYSVGNALEAAAGEVPAPLRQLIAAEERVGRLPQGVRFALGQRRETERLEPAGGALIWGYPAAVVCTMSLVLLGVFLLIVPKFIKIFEDFDAPMPKATLALIEFVKWFGGPLLGMLGSDTYNEDQLVPGVVWVLFLLIFAFGFWLLVKTGPLLGAWGYVAWWLPWARREALARACHVAEQALLAGVPTHEALRLASACRLNRALDLRMARWTRGIEAGQPIDAAAAAAGMPGCFAELTAPAERTGNLAEVFGFLSRHNRLNAAKWATLARSAAVTGTIAALAAVTGFIVVALFVPLVKLIQVVM